MNSLKKKVVICYLLRKKQQQKKKKKYWVHPLLQSKPRKGAFHNLINELKDDDATPPSITDCFKLTAAQRSVSLSADRIIEIHIRPNFKQCSAASVSVETLLASRQRFATCNKQPLVRIAP